MSVARTNRIWRGLLSLVVLASLAFTLNRVAFSGASYATGSASPASVFVAGSLSHTNDQDGRAVIEASGLVPGMSSIGTMKLTGSGTVSGAYTLSAESLTDTPAAAKLSNVLTLKIIDITGAETVLYEGSVSAFSTVALGAIAPGGLRTYRITLAYPAGANKASLQGAATALSMKITGETT
jgi:hypothetical protein